MNLEFIQATKEDASLIIEIQNQAFKEDFIKYGVCPAYGGTVQSITKSLINNPKYIIIADCIAIGTVSAHETNGNGYLSCLCVIPEYENLGIGQKAVKFIENKFPQAKTWSLKTPKDKIRNHYFYKKCGYEIVTEEMDRDVPVVILYKELEII